MRRAFAQPIVALSLAIVAWAGVSVLWTPFSIAAGQHLLKLALWLISLFLLLTTTRGHARATDVYLFPFGLVLGMAAMLAAFIADRYGAEIPRERIFDGAIVLVTTLFPVMGGLAARGRNGWGRLLLILGLRLRLCDGLDLADVRHSVRLRDAVVRRFGPRAHDARSRLDRRRADAVRAAGDDPDRGADARRR